MYFFTELYTYTQCYVEQIQKTHNYKVLYKDFWSKLVLYYISATTYEPEKHCAYRLIQLG